MRQDYCDITLVLDESGSMEPLENDTIGGVNKFLSDQRKQPGKCVCSIMKFNHEDHPVFTGRPIQEAPDLTTGTYSPNGNTALLDALGRAITEAGDRFRAMAETERPGKVIVVVITDGEENSSRRYTKSQVKEMIERQTNTYKWEFVFLGANIDAFAEAGGLGIGAGHALHYQATPRGLRLALGELTANSADYRIGKKSSMAWTDQQRREQEEENSGQS